MKKFLKVACACVAMALICSLAACSTYKPIRKAFEKAGWSENQDVEEYNAKYQEEAEEKDISLTIHVMAKNGSLLKAVVILEFSSSEDLAKYLADDEDAKAFLEDLQKYDYVSGTCLLINLTGGTEAMDIWKSTK